MARKKWMLVSAVSVALWAGQGAAAQEQGDSFTQEQPHAPPPQSMSQEQEPMMRARSAVSADLGLGAVVVGNFSSQGLSGDAGLGVPIRLDVSAEFPVNKSFVVGAHVRGGIFQPIWGASLTADENAAEVSSNKTLGLLDVGPTIMPRILISDMAAWQVPMYARFGMVLGSASAFGVNFGGSLLGWEFFVSDDVGIRFDALAGFDMFIGNGVAWSWRALTIGVVLPWG